MSGCVLSTFHGRNHLNRRIETIRVGNAAVNIYRRTRTVDGNRYPTFEVCDYTGGRRRLRSFAEHQAAQREARRIARLLAKGDAVAAALPGQEAASFAWCLELLRAVGDRVSRVVVYVVATNPCERARIEARRQALVAAEAAIGFDPGRNPADLAVLQDMVRKKQ
jgi:hypothetical protein